MLTAVNLPGVSLTATSEEVLDVFYRPVLAQSSLYQRGAAYFSITFYLRLMDALVEFVLRGGIVQLVTSVHLDEETVASVSRGYELTDQDMTARLQSVLDDYQARGPLRELDEAKLDVIANMIAARRFVMKVAYLPTRGIYHEKMGVFSDDVGNAVSFIGSANATVNAFHENFETVNVFSSWTYSKIVEEHREHFRKMWRNEIPELRVIPFPEAVEQKLLSAYRKSGDVATAVEKLEKCLKKGCGGTRNASLRPYQLDAIDQFEQRKYRTFFEMATGTGKTFTAIKAIERMMKTHPLLNVVILVPLRDLQDQWEVALRNCLSVRSQIFKFGGNGKSEVSNFNLASATGYIVKEGFASIAICVYNKFFSDVYAKMAPVGGEMLLVVDEAHNLTPKQLKKLAGFTNYRLGLSATPSRYSKAETEAVLNYFLEDGQESFKFGLEEAIRDGYLSPYRYYPIQVPLTDDEWKSYQELSHKIAVAQSVYARDPTKSNKKSLDDLKIRRSLIVKRAKNKLVVLERLVATREYDFHNAVVFCGPGGMDRGDGRGVLPVVDFVTEILSLHSTRRYFPVKFTCAESSDRATRLDTFREGTTDTLIAVKCFDEGMDVPALDKIYILASDSSLRQTIQRRGRVLRVSKETGKVRAYIYDFVAGWGEGDCFVPLPADCCRVKEYARLAQNPESSKRILAFYRENDTAYDFDDDLLEEDE